MMVRTACQLISDPLEIFVAGRFPMKKAWNTKVYETSTIALHQHFYSGTAEIGGQAFPFQSGDFTLMPPNTPCKFRIAADGWHWCVHFSSSRLSPKTSLRIPFHVSSPLIIDNNVLAKTVWWWQRAHNLPKSLARAARRIAPNALFEALAVLAFSSEPASAELTTSSRADQAALKVHGIILERLSEPLTMPELAREAGVSERSLRRAFRVRFGMPVSAFLLKWRVEMGARLLSVDSKSVKEIASIVGFADQQYFNKQFRRFMGCAPVQWRNRWH